MDALVTAVRQRRMADGRRREGDSAARLEQLRLEHGSEAKSWPELFQAIFIDRTEQADDLLMLVVKDPPAGDKVLEVYRRGSTTRPMPPVGGAKYNWEECTSLNLLLQQVTYSLTCAVCSREPTSKRLQVLRKLTNQVYASPSKRSMETKMNDEVITFPLLYFSIDDFDQRFEDVVVQPDEIICVELVGELGATRSTVFSGAVGHNQLAASFNSKSGRSWVSTGAKEKMEFLHMRGPKGLGQAEMAVSISEPKSGGATSGPGLGGKLGSLTRATLSFVKGVTSGGPNAAESGLNAYLTFVSLSWETMMESLVDAPVAPALDKKARPPPSSAQAMAASPGGGAAQ